MNPSEAAEVLKVMRANVAFVAGHFPDVRERVVLEAAALDLAIDALEVKAKVAPARKTDPTTSHRAAPTEFKAGSARHLILRAAYTAWSVGADAMTARELTDRADLGHQRSPWKRVSELHEAGFLASVGSARDSATGQYATVYEITKKGVGAIAGAKYE